MRIIGAARYSCVPPYKVVNGEQLEQNDRTHATYAIVNRTKRIVGIAEILFLISF